MSSALGTVETLYPRRLDSAARHSALRSAALVYAPRHRGLLSLPAPAPALQGTACGAAEAEEPAAGWLTPTSVVSPRLKKSCTRATPTSQDEGDAPHQATSRSTRHHRSRFLAQTTSPMPLAPIPLAPMPLAPAPTGATAGAGAAAGGDCMTTSSSSSSLAATAAAAISSRTLPEVFGSGDDGRKAVEQVYAGEFLIPAVRPSFTGKLVVVLDLDETLVSSRETAIHIRPGTVELLQSLKDHCELIVWTAGTRDYALEVIRRIDPHHAVQHCIYRHPAWWSGETGCTKDLRMLGRPMDKIVFVDNTPDVFRANPQNSVLVSDFEGYGTEDNVLYTIADIFRHVFRRFASPVATDFFASRRVKARTIPLDNGTGHLQLNTIVDDKGVMVRPPGGTAARHGFQRCYRYV